MCRLLDSCRIAAAFQSDASHRRRVVQILGAAWMRLLGCRGPLTRSPAGRVRAVSVGLDGRVSEDMGMGKSAMCREFCGYFSSPGRMFANRAFLVDEAGMSGRGTSLP